MILQGSPAGARRALLVLSCLALGASGCASTKRAGAEQAQLIAPPGALLWADDGLLLPARSPLVASLRASEALYGINSLFSWLTQEPAMFVDGEEVTRGIANMRTGIGQALDFDPLSARAWERLGIDLTATLRVALWPLDEAGERFVADTESLMRQSYEVTSSQSLLERLASSRDEGPDGTLAASHALYQPLKRLGEHEAGFGVRLVIGIADEQALLKQLDRLMTKRGARVALTQDQGPAPLRRIYFTPASDGARVSAQVVGARMVLDLMIPTTAEQLPEGAPVVESVRAQVIARLKALKVGRPDAPAPQDSPVAALSFDQRGFSALMRYRTWRTALARAERAEARQREAQLADELALGASALQHWEVGAPGLTGFVYGLWSGPELTRHAGLRVSLFGDRRLAPVSTSAPGPGLGVSARSAGMSLDPALLFGKDWLAWVGMSDPARLLEDLLSDNGDLDEHDALLFLPLLRNTLLVAQNAGVLLRQEAPLELIPLYNHRERITRVEIATTGLRLTGFMARPTVVALLGLKPELPLTDRDAVTGALRETLRAFASLRDDDDDDARGEEGAEEGASSDATAQASPPDAAAASPPSAAEAPARPMFEPFTAGAITPLTTDAADPLASLSYYYQREGDAPFVLLGYDLDAQTMAREVAQASAPERAARPEALYARVEIVGLIEAMFTYDQLKFDLIDLNVLAQRLGPLVAHVASSSSRGVNTIHYGLDLMRPPSLD